MSGLTSPISRAVAAFALVMLAPTEVALAKPLSDGAFAARVCDIFVSPIGYPPATGNMTFGAGAGCTWKVGHGDVGETATEITIMALRNAGPEMIAKTVADFDDMFNKLANFPGSKVKNIPITCDVSGAPAKMILWGIQSKQAILGYAICGNTIVHGTVAPPPDSDMDTEAIFVDLMTTTARMIND